MLNLQVNLKYDILKILRFPIDEHGFLLINFSYFIFYNFQDLKVFKIVLITFEYFQCYCNKIF